MEAFWRIVAEKNLETYKTKTHIMISDSESYENTPSTNSKLPSPINNKPQQLAIESCFIENCEEAKEEKEEEKMTSNPCVQTISPLRRRKNTQERNVCEVGILPRAFLTQFSLSFP